MKNNDSENDSIILNKADCTGINLNSEADMVIIMEEAPSSPDVVQLLDELSNSLEHITGGSGRNSFNTSDVCVLRSSFVIARYKS